MNAVDNFTTVPVIETPQKEDPLGELLTKYDEYFDGHRPYGDLPLFPGADPGTCEHLIVLTSWTESGQAVGRRCSETFGCGRVLDNPPKGDTYTL